MSEELSPWVEEAPVSVPPTNENVAKTAPRPKKEDPAPRRLPQNTEAERFLLGSFLLEPRSVGGLCVEKGIESAHFHLDSHAWIYAQMLKMWDVNDPIDIVTLTHKLRESGKLDKVGGPAYVSELIYDVRTAMNAREYADIIEEQFILRRGIEVCTRYADSGYSAREGAEKWLDDLERDIMGIRKARPSQTKTMKQLVVEAIGSIEQMYERRGEISGISTGFHDLDKLTDGMHGAEMWVLAGRPSSGKTSLLMNVVDSLAIDQGKKLAIFSQETYALRLVEGMLCSRARVNLSRVRDGFLSERDFPALQVAASKLAQSNIQIEDTPGLDIMTIRAKARRLRDQHGIEFIGIDYLQLLRGSRRSSNRQEEVSEISLGIKHLSMELNLPIMVLAQLNRNPEGRTGGRPRLSDLRESGSIEQDADITCLLHRDEMYADNDEEKAMAEGKATLILAKQKRGPTGDVPLTFLKEFSRFETRAREPEEHQPDLPNVPNYDPTPDRKKNRNSAL